MEKLEYNCDAQKLNYVFAKRRWYEKKVSRSISILLQDMTTHAQVGDIRLNIRENGERQVVCRMDKDERAALYLAALNSFLGKRIRYQELLLFDGEETEVFTEILMRIAQNANVLTVISENPLQYQQTFEEIYEQTGLLSTALPVWKADNLSRNTQEENKPYYQRQKYMPSKMLVLWAEFTKKPPIRSFPKECCFVDFSFDARYEKEVAVKRKDITYYGLGKFLDTTVKSRYNTLVKDGKVNQYVILDNNKKFCKKRRGNKKWKKKRTF
ncbi:MAG: hypothetical protein PUB13_05225 [Lachnospiraceae bacterium]|nr:hypothetical protein [Lachnospiraceae bacterium]